MTGAAGQAPLYNGPVNFPVRAISLDLDDTLWPFAPIGDRIERTLHDLALEPEAMSHPQGTQLKVSRQELARLVGCSREMAGRVLKKLQVDGKLHARGKTVVLFGTR